MHSSASDYINASLMIKCSIMPFLQVIAYEFDRLRQFPKSDWNAQELSAAAANPQATCYVNVVPFDQNRVILHSGASDYINASLLTKCDNLLFCRSSHMSLTG